MTWAGKTLKPAGTGPSISVEEFDGPSSYDTSAGYTVTLSNISKISNAIAMAVNTSDSSVTLLPVVESVSDNTAVIRFYWSNGTGAAFSEVTSGTDLSDYKVIVVAFGQ